MILIITVEYSMALTYGILPRHGNFRRSDAIVTWLKMVLGKRPTNSH